LHKAIEGDSDELGDLNLAPWTWPSKRYCVHRHAHCSGTFTGPRWRGSVHFITWQSRSAPSDQPGHNPSASNKVFPVVRVAPQVKESGSCQGWVAFLKW